jgi:hypothetical protein
VIDIEVERWRGVTMWDSVGGSGFACAFKITLAGNLVADDRGGCELAGDEAWRSPPNKNDDEAAPSTNDTASGTRISILLLRDDFQLNNRDLLVSHGGDNTRVPLVRQKRPSMAGTFTVTRMAGVTRCSIEAAICSRDTHCSRVPTNQQGHSSKN